MKEISVCATQFPTDPSGVAARTRTERFPRPTALGASCLAGPANHFRNLAVCALVLILAAPAEAVRLVREPSYMLNTNQSVSEELWIVADQEAILGGEISNDVAVLAQRIDLSGMFRGDVLAAGAEVRFGGLAQDALRLAGKTITLHGRAEQNVAAVALAIEVGEQASLARDAVLWAEHVIVKGDVSNLLVMATDATISGHVRGKLRIASADIVILPGTVIEGDLLYTSPEELALDSHVVVKGNVRRIATPPGGFQRHEPTLRGVLSFAAFQYVGALLAGLAFAAMFPGVAGVAVQSLRRRIGWCGLIGFLSIGLIPITSAVLLFTIVGIPLGLLLLVSGVLLAYLAKVPVALIVGSAILRLRGPTPFRSVAAALIIGFFFLYACALLPYIGTLVAAMTLVFGLGSLLTAIFTRDRALRVIEQSTVPPLPSPPPLPSARNNGNPAV